MREAQKVERFRLPFSSLFPVRFGVPPEFDPARLVRVEFQPEFRQPLPQVGQETVSFLQMLEPEDRVVGVPHHDHVSPRAFLAPDVHPDIEHLM